MERVCPSMANSGDRQNSEPNRTDRTGAHLVGHSAQTQQFNYNGGQSQPPQTPFVVPFVKPIECMFHYNYNGF